MNRFPTQAGLTRRTVAAAALALAAAAGAQTLPRERVLTFALWRNGRKIGRHSVAFKGDPGTFVATIETTAKVGFGPLTVYQYHFQAAETWTDGQFSTFESQAVTNGRAEWVKAVRSPGAVLIRTEAGSHSAAPATLPLTHWNRDALHRPLFDFQTGALLHETVTSEAGQAVQLADGRTLVATRYGLTGDLDVSEWYDARDEWVGMRIKAMDGSIIEYQRIT